MDLAEMSPEVARELARNKDSLLLGSLSALPPEALAECANREHSAIFGSTEAITTDAAKTLARLPPEAAKAVGHHKGEYLRLDGLTTLSDEAAKALRANPEISLLDKFKR